MIIKTFVPNVYVSIAEYLIISHFIFLWNWLQFEDVFPLLKGLADRAFLLS